MEDLRTAFDDQPTDGWPALDPDALLRNWRNLPPVLTRPGVVLREVEPGDAVPLFALLSRDGVSQVVYPVPATVGDLAGQIDLARMERLAGRGICFVVLVDQRPQPVGLFRVRELERGFRTAQWEFVLAPELWGGGVFFAAAPAVVDFAFDVLGAHRLEGRAPACSGRANGALRKMGAVQECVLRRSLQQDNVWIDQALWTLVADDWRKRTGRRGIH